MQQTGALGGHVLQQAITCGVPTMTREMALMYTYHAISNSPVVKSHPWIPVAVQAGVSAGAVATQMMVRQRRIARDADAAAKGHFGLSDDQWNAMDAAEQQHKRDVQQRDSRKVTWNQVGAEAVMLTLGAHAASRGDFSIGARVVALHARNLIYAAMREPGQATLDLVKTNGPATHGVNDNNMTTMAAHYTAMTFAMTYAADVVVSHVMGKQGIFIDSPSQGVTTGPALGPALSRADGTALQGAELAKAAATIAAIRSAFNTVGEISDAGMGKHLAAQQVGAKQALNTDNPVPAKDYGRLKDHAVARFAWNQAASAASLATTVALKGSGMNQSAPRVTQFLGYAALALTFGTSYRNTNQTYQAHARVRKAVANPPNP